MICMLLKLHKPNFSQTKFAQNECKHGQSLKPTAKHKKHSSLTQGALFALISNFAYILFSCTSCGRHFNYYFPFTIEQNDLQPADLGDLLWASKRVLCNVQPQKQANKSTHHRRSWVLHAEIRTFPP